MKRTTRILTTSDGVDAEREAILLDCVLLLLCSQASVASNTHLICIPDIHASLRRPDLLKVRNWSVFRVLLTCLVHFKHQMCKRAPASFEMQKPLTSATAYLYNVASFLSQTIFWLLLSPSASARNCLMKFSSSLRDRVDVCVCQYAGAFER